MIKQLIVLQNIDNKSPMEISQMICNASMAFIKDDLKNNAYKFSKYKMYHCVAPHVHSYMHYKDERLNSISQCNFMAGRKVFSVKETYEDGVLINIEEVPETYIYDCNIELQEDVYEKWLFCGMPKTVLVGNEALSEVLTRANKYALNKYVDYFVGKSDNVEYISFVPTDEHIVDTLSKGLEIYK